MDDWGTSFKLSEEVNIFLFFSVRLILGPSQSPSQKLPKAPLTGANDQGMKPTTHFHLQELHTLYFCYHDLVFNLLLGKFIFP
jgi:hypothetical protein